MHNFEVANDVIIKSPTLNPYATAKLCAIKINLSANAVSAAGDKKLLIPVIAGLMSLTGQRPRPLKATDSVAAFKVRKMMEIGAELTMRGKSLITFANRLRVLLPLLTAGNIITKRMGLKELTNALSKGETGIISQKQRLGGAHIEFQVKGEG
jgi:ribosomal protein L5